MFVRVVHSLPAAVTRALALLPLMLVACATRSAERDPLAGRTAGEPVNCISLSQSTSPQVVDQNTILYREGAGRRIWRTGPKGACPALSRAPVTLIVEVFNGPLCRNDRFRVLEPGLSIPSGYCFFTDFTPYDLPPKS